jgi:probable phosphoglycerate mutase
MARGGLPPDGIVLVRHGATEWSEASRHTGRTDLPLLAEGRRQAEELAKILNPADFGQVLCSPLRRARETCELAGFGERAEICPELHEWDYGDYEGLTTVQIHELRPDWWLWRDGCPGGEMPDQVVARADRVIALVAGDSAGPAGGSEPANSGEPAGGGRPALLFAHGHILRVLAARWIELDATGGSRLMLKPAALGVLGHERDTRAISGWNVTSLA